VRILFVQPFGVGGPGGGPRILRTLIRAASLDALSVCTSPDVPPRTDLVEERHLRSRPALGSFEHTRLAPSLAALDTAYQRRLARNLRAAAVEWRAEAVHSVAHSVDFWPAFRVSQALRLPYLLSVHDDLRYALRGSPARRPALRRLGEAWRAADARFVITDQLGTEYCERYGDRGFAVVTDGLESIADRPPEPSDSTLHVYFMGAYHTAYRDNFDTLLAALARLRRERPEREVSLTWRGGGLPFEHESEVPMEVRGFGPEDAPQREAGDADLLYLPLPFGKAHRDFVRFSLSTKLVTYLGTGRPIVYHGPKEAAAARLLIEHDAAIVVDSPRPEDLVAALDRGLPQARSMGANALALARREFAVSDVRDRFLSELEGLGRE
jgi:glycosyltransferase involved in cell wall biosynthesis